MNITINLAGLDIGIDLIYPENREYFGEFLTDNTADEIISVSPDEITRRMAIYPAGTPISYVEFAELSYRASDVLRKHGIFMYHGTAFVWKDRAWIFAAPSGTGKTTQYFLWKKLLGDEITLLNGDKPLLKREENEIVVHSSPWKGKEGMHNNISAPLGGIICLRQSEINRVEQIPVSKSLLPILRQFHLDWKNDEAVLSAFEMLSGILEKTPVWKLENRGDEMSAALTIDAIKSCEVNKAI